MKLLRAATLTTPDPEATAARYAEWLDYSVIDRGVVEPGLAESWGCPGSAGKAYVVARPASGADVYLRFVQGDGHRDYRPLRTFGWAAIEICVQDVLKVNERMERSPFEIIGPPKQLDGMPTIFPMQVKGPDGEIVYLTEIRGDLPAYDLPRAGSLIDKLFILVMGCSDLRASLEWFKDHVGLEFGRELDIIYTMLNQAFDLPMEHTHTIVTGVHERDVFLEFDQYPEGATPRPGPAGELSPGIALCTLKHPDFDSVKGPWISEPVRREGPVYGGGRVGTLRAPDGTLVEIVEIV
jgi:catechol 2,3-dioxygenase-like lactoylglutathione lyase family enzyme